MARSARKDSRGYKKNRMWAKNFKQVEFDIIKVIVRKFIEPMLRAFKFTAEEDWLRSGIPRWFATTSRALFFGIAKRSFTLPGQVRHVDSGQLYLPADKDRQVRTGNEVVVRFDDVQPTIVEVEFKEKVFHMSKEQWDGIRSMVALIG